MKTCFYLFFFFSVFLLGTKEKTERTLLINFTHSTHIESLPSRTSINATLISNEKYSLYEMNYRNNQNLIDEEDDDNGQTFLSIKTSSNPYIFKNYLKKIMFSKERIVVKPMLVKDSINIFNWTLTNNKKTILTYPCQEAKLFFRGRNYTAFFTTELNFNGGPWKFSGLPGVILEIKSDDGVFEISANDIRVINKSTKIENPFENLEESITWDEFIKKYRKKYDELLSYVDENNVTMSIPKRKIEVLIED